MTRRYWTAAVVLCLAGAGTGHADDQRAAPAAFSQPLSDSALAAERGGAAAKDETQILNTISINGRADNISVNNSTTGDNFVGGGSFTGSRGFPTVIQNSGNGVLIQNATIINMTLKP
jgi:hypothetical protein